MIVIVMVMAWLMAPLVDEDGGCDDDEYTDDDDDDDDDGDEYCGDCDAGD